MTRSVRLFSLRHIPVSADWGLFAIGAVFAFGLSRQVLPQFDPSAPWLPRVAVAIGTVIVFFICVLIHEVGHAYFARQAGLEVERITLSFYGGSAVLGGHAPTPGYELAIALAGPVANLILGAVFALFAWLAKQGGLEQPLIFGALVWLAGVNLMLALLNLIPVAPLDGGRVLTSVLWWRNGQPETSRIYAARAGLVAGATLIVAAGFRVRWSLTEAVVLGFIAVFIIAGAHREMVAAFIRRRLRSVTAADIMTPLPSTPIHDSTTVAGLLNGSGFDIQGRVVPVTRWDREPIGWVAIDQVWTLSEAERSWTSLGEVMVPAADVTRVWSDQSVDEVLDEIESRSSSATYLPVVVHDRRDGREIGTIGSADLQPQFARPDYWGRPAKDTESHSSGKLLSKAGIGS